MSDSASGSSITRGESSEKKDVEGSTSSSDRSTSLNQLEKGENYSGHHNNNTHLLNSEKDDVVVEGDKIRPRFVPFSGRKVPRKPYTTLEEAPPIPLTTASIFSIWTFWWIQPLLVIGYQRTLEPKDLWKLTPDLTSGHLADKLMENFNRRKLAVELNNSSLDDGSYKPTVMRRTWWKVQSSVFGYGKGDGKQTIGLAGAISDTFFWQFWGAGMIKIAGDMCQVLSPLVTKALINFSTQSYYANQGYPGFVKPEIGVGVGLAIGLWLMQIVYSLATNQFFARSATTGVLARGALISSVYRKAMVLSGKARVVATNGKLINNISTDISRIDFCCSFFHMSWTAPIQLIVIVIILLVNIGPSCLAGIGFLCVTLPLQAMAMKSMFAFRKKAMVWTDKRAKLIQELLGGMRVIKFFSWEQPYLAKLAFIRKSEMTAIRKLLSLRAGNTAVALSMPMLGTVITFLVYAGTGHSQNPAIIFTSLTLFNLIRMPLMMLPMSLSTITDAYNALGRLTEVLLAEERSGTYELNLDSKFAVEVVEADFQWEGAAPETAPLAKGAKGANKAEAKKLEAKLKAEKKKSKKTALSGVKGLAEISATATPASLAEAEIMQLNGINLKIPKGQLCAIVGSVGSGKSSLLQALVGEMKRTKGSVSFGGSIAYAAQTPWIQNATLKDNILFGQHYDEARYDQVIRDSCLNADLLMLPNGDLTEIGEKGITLSGGQKQRVNIARALYYNADIVLLDDPLSAVDAHVGKHLFDHAICGSLKDKTRILVTHALHFLPSVDYIICLEHGKITQQGTYADLISDREGAFSTLVREFGGGEESKAEVKEEIAIDALEKDDAEAEVIPIVKAKALMQEEERATGAVTGTVYRKFFGAANGRVTIPLLFGSLVLSQASQVLGSYWLVWWQEDQFNREQGFYMGLYAFFGLGQAFFSFLMGLSGVYLGYNASKSLHHGAITGVMRAPMSFFDTSPLGRIMNRFSKDVDTIDNVLNDSMRMFFATASSVLGAIILIGIVEPYFVIAVVFILGLYWLAAQFYRCSAREIKRCDNLLRSSLYAHFSESLSGLATIRAYGESAKFLKQNEGFIDIENRAYYLTVINQRWLGVRLDFFGGVLTFIVAMIGVGARDTISPAQIGLILSYILTISSAFTWMVRQGAEVENDMNSVERLLHYANELEREAPAVIESARPPTSWPEHGAIKMDKLVMSYRHGLPPVLKGLSLDIHAGEKIGVCGRTGAGKSSIMMALFRIVELSRGSITIDGIDISTIGLQDLREKIAIIPQDALLFNGTIRSNLDPFSQFDDAVLWDALKRSWLVDQSSEHGDVATALSSTGAPASRFTLDLVIEDEGNNLSVGERSLVSLARALVKDSKIVVLDEATASIDFATDARVQNTIRTEFKEKTLLCIAHRLRTIINYDRVLVMSDGEVAEFDTPLNLYRSGKIFRSMCDRSNLTEADILKTEF